MEKETEFKFLLTGAEHQKLLECLEEPSRTRRFVNRYYTVNEILDRRDWVFRLRVEDDKRELTLKIGRELEPGLFDSQEFNQLVESENPADWQQTEPWIVLRREISQESIVLQGESVTERHICAPPIPVGHVWEVDLCTLPGGETFCELEIEVPASIDLDVSRRNVLEWLDSRGLRPKVSEKTKYARFLAAVKSGP